MVVFEFSANQFEQKMYRLNRMYSDSKGTFGISADNTKVILVGTRIDSRNGDIVTSSYNNTLPFIEFTPNKSFVMYGFGTTFRKME